MDNEGSRTTRICIGNVIKTTIQEGTAKFNKFHREITVTNPLFGNAEYTMKIPQSDGKISLTDTVKWIYKNGIVDKMENSLFGNMLKRLHTIQPETPAVTFLKELLPSFKQSGCSKKTINSMVNTAVEADRKRLQTFADAIPADKQIKPTTTATNNKFAGSKKEQIIQKYS